jgi:acetyl-CoA synthetase
MHPDRISKQAATSASPPNLIDYAQTRAEFSWVEAGNVLTGLPDNGGINIGFETVDRHVHDGRAQHPALIFIDKDFASRTLSFADLSSSSNRFANVLADLGVEAADAIFALSGRNPLLYAAAVGTWKQRAVFCAMFAAFGPEPIAARMTIGRARVLVTTAALYRRKILPIRERLIDLRHVLLIDAEHGDLPDGTLSLPALLAGAGDAFTIPPTDPEDIALLHFTSGTTGKPKGALHAHAAVLAHHVTARYALDLKPDDTYWCTADPGWVTGISYGVVAPLSIGATSIVDEAEFDVERWYRILDEQRVSVWYTAPTAVRMMMKYGTDLATARRLDALRFIASVGEPLNPEAVTWGQAAFGLPFHDNWWQTETGGIMIANYAAVDIKPGSMGLPMPGIEAAVVRRRDDGTVEVVEAIDEEGELALRPGWPSMFRGYLDEDERYRQCFADGWYLSGDLARVDADGYFWFVGRADDVIKSSGHLIGPFEVESALMEHPAVAEVGVIGKPDPVAMEIVKAFVALNPGHAPDDALRRELIGFARKRLGAAVAPKEIEFSDDLPKTRSGKIMRRLLKARELGLPEGDTSTLERRL